MSTVPRQFAVTLAHRQHWRCIWCEFEVARSFGVAERLIRSERPSQSVTIDPQTLFKAADAIVISFEHFLPRAAHGADTIDNGLCSCRWCNSYRGAADALIFKAHIVALVAAEQHPRQVFRINGYWPSTQALRRRSGAPALPPLGAVA